MLSELRIQNFAIIDQLELTLGSGLIILTGETGAGKSIILDAVVMLIGGRAETTAIRAEADNAFVEGVFRLSGPEKEAILPVLEREELLDDRQFVTLTREIRREGRSVARVNGRTVNVSLLRELGALLVDIHGQSEHLSLLDTRAHLGLLDRFSDVSPVLNDYRNNYHKILAVRRELSDLRQAQADAERRTELLTYQADEIEAAKLKPGEESGLREERDRLANAESLAENARQALTVLDEGTAESPAATDLIGQAVSAITGLAKIDATRSGLLDQATGMEDLLVDLVRSLRIYLEEIEFNPKRLEEVEERLDLIHSLTRKYGGSIESVIAFAEQARKQLDSISHASERIEAMEAEEAELLKKLGEQAGTLSKSRKTAAGKLSQGIESELEDLRMAAAKFAVDFKTKIDATGIPDDSGNQLAFDQNGFDQVEFLVAPNPGEGMKPLVKIASGGETSRLMLALKNVLARADEIPSLIFDEIDQGIGGRVGLVVGYKLWNLARNHQVFCVTHLPQLAVFGEQHFQVQKLVKDNRTLTRVELLSGESRMLELAQMLGEVSEGTLRSAHEILQTAEQMRKNTQ